MSITKVEFESPVRTFKRAVSAKNESIIEDALRLN